MEEYYKGDKITLTPVDESKAGRIIEPITGEVLEISARGILRIAGDDGRTLRYHTNGMVSVAKGGFGLPYGEGRFSIQRTNTRELGEEFYQILEAELNSTESLAKEGNENQRAGALATIRNLNNRLERK